MKDDTEKERLILWPEDRIAGFTDGIFAFSITLLVLNLIGLNIPAGNQSLIPILIKNISSLITFAATFFIIARFWMAHVRLFAIIKEYDGRIVRLNNTLLFFITAFPFVALLLGTHISNRSAVIIYAMLFAIIGIIQYLIGRHAYKAHLLVTDGQWTKDFLKTFTTFSLSTPAIFIISIAIAFVSPISAEIAWIAIFFLRTAFRYYYKNNHISQFEVEIL
jgi:uncharacterized membrane protein